VPEFGTLWLTRQQLVVERDRVALAPHEEIDLGLRLKHQVTLFAALERRLVLAQRLGVVALAAEREPEVVAGELPFAGDLQLALRLCRGGTLHALLVDRKVGVRAR